MTTETKTPEMTALEMAQRILQMASKSPNAITHLQNDECRLAGALIDSEARNAELEKKLDEATNEAIRWHQRLTVVCHTINEDVEAVESLSKEPDWRHAFQLYDLQRAKAMVARNAELAKRVGELEKDNARLKDELNWQNRRNSGHPTKGGYEFYINEEWTGIASAPLNYDPSWHAALRKKRIDPDDERVRIRRVAEDDELITQIDRLTAQLAEAQADGLSRITRWIEAHCDGDWEHQNGLKIESSDNPGMFVKLSVDGTEADNLGIKEDMGDETEELTIESDDKTGELLGYCEPPSALPKLLQRMADILDAAMKAPRA